MKTKDFHEATVCFFVKYDPAIQKSLVYLAVKGQKTGIGCRMSHGGHLEPNETPRACVKREVWEESEFNVIIDPRLIRYVALGEFTTDKGDGALTVFKVHFFIADEWDGDFISTPDMSDGKWYPVDDLPINELMLADRYWLGTVLRDNVEQRAQFYLIDVLYGRDQQSLLSEVAVTPNRQISVL